MKKIREGKIELSIPKGRIYDASVFYNPEAEMTRDISVAAVSAFGRGKTICDALSASGARGIRYAKELKGVKVFLNDKNPKAVKLIKKNVSLNKLKNCVVSKRDANLLMRENVFNVIDLDPFGSPNIFLDSAGRSIYHKGFLAVTATDQAALNGKYPGACMRKYGIKVFRTPYYNELGVRTLITFIINSLSRYERAFVPVLSFSTKHYYRVFGKIEHSGKIENLMKDIDYVSDCKCGEFKRGVHKKCKCGKKFRVLGPVYLGKIQRKPFCRKVLKELQKRKFKLLRKEEKLLKTIISEKDAPFYYDLHYLAKKRGVKIPRMKDILKKNLSRTHFCDTAVKGKL